MDIAQSLPSTLTSLSFSFLTAEEIKAISVKRIVNPVLLDHLNRPTIGGLYDPALGPSEANDICTTCHLSSFSCPGHFGHIELPTAVYHPLFFIQCYALVRQCCMFCHRFRVSEAEVVKFIGRMTLLNHGLLNASLKLENMYQVLPKPKEKKEVKKKRKAGVIDDEAGEGSEDEEEEEEDQEMEDAESNRDGEPIPESADQYIKRIQQFVQSELQANSSGAGKDNYKDGLVYDERRKVIHAWSKMGGKKCNRCKAFAHTYRKEGHTKIVEYDLTTKQKAMHAATGRKQPDVKRLLSTAFDDATPADAQDSGSEAEEDNDIPDADEEEEDGEEGEGDDLDEAGNSKKLLATDISGRQKKTTRGRQERVMPSDEVFIHLKLLFKNEPIITTLLYGRHGPFAVPGDKATADMFFLTVLPVPPTRFRPAARMGEILFEHPQNELLSKVLNTTFRVVELGNQNKKLRSSDPETKMELTKAQLEKEQLRVYGQFLDAMFQLQVDVNSFMDSSKNPTVMRQGKLPPPGVKQTLEKKEGLFRKHMMGKRVNYAARSVISPDVNIETTEIGIPPVFARKLTYPEPVTAANVHAMRQLVINGPKKWPGATTVQNEDGSLTTLDKKTEEQRTAIANLLMTPQQSGSGGPSFKTPSINKKVYRHLQDGDILLLNRQPTLHKPSMMAHKAKVLLGEKTIRMHYANCNSYNADFDGDEMNIHFPQNEIPRSEAYNIANTDSQYLSSTSGGPLRGLIQDSIVAGVWMCNKETFFTRDEYHQLIYGALRPEDNYSGQGKVITVPPTIWKPQPMWTGKQLISTVLKNITPTWASGLNLESKNKTKNELWGPHSKENEVLFMDGELLIGILDKSQYGASSYGLVHSVYEVYSAECAGKLLSILSRLFAKFLSHRAFSCRMDDLIMTPEGEKERLAILENINEDAKKAAISYVGLPEDSDPNDEQTMTNLNIRLEEVLRKDDLMAALDGVMQNTFNQKTSEANKKCVPNFLVKSFPDNGMQLMTVSGAKGSATNANMISSVLGQQSLEGRRVPTMVSGKTLPSFKPFETAARAGGYVQQRFLTGIRPQEYYFHCMSGREGLIDTAVKTSRSGYLQRCLIKHLEGIRVHYDHTVRDSDNSVVQFHYGEDSLDVIKQGHLDVKQFKFNIDNSNSLVSRYRPSAIDGVLDSETAVDHMKKVLKSKKRQQEDPSVKDKYPPTLSKYSPSCFVGSMSEKYAQQIDDYVEKNKDKLIVPKKNKKAKTEGGDVADEEGVRLLPGAIKGDLFKNLMRVRYLRALIDPGEAVGLLAAQGVGEPSTQMTLNTFHLAGHGAANVTLGIPRLRELVMTASTKPKTPMMKLPVLDSVPEETFTRFIKKAKRVTLSELVEKVTVTESLSAKTEKNGQTRSRTYTVLLDFYPMEEYLEEHDVTPLQILQSMPYSFGIHIKNEILKELKEVGKMVKADLENVGKGTAVRIPRGSATATAEMNEDGAAAGGRDDESEVGDGDAEDEKRASKKQQKATYDSDDDDEEDEDLDDIEGAFPDADEEQEKKDREDELRKKERQLEKKAHLKQRVQDLSDQFLIADPKHLSRFSFDIEGGRSCEFDLDFPGDSQKLLVVDIIERCCQKAVVHHIPLIDKGIRMRKGTGEDEKWENAISWINENDLKSKKIAGNRVLQTEGSNIKGMWDHAFGLIDMNYIYSNDVAAMLRTYGVEAARASIIAEVSGVFGVYGITINYRHLSLIADYMTHEGGYKPFNRTGISSKSSPLLKASFETTANFLAEATLHGDFDDLRSPSANIVMGKPSINGTAVFDVMSPYVEV